mmetsp:Transcript_79294/g.220490  ORF Transcript_79294/g.220490 Transcript_79294/m.220490 type:complete len:253 (-) Transcript_79294:3345-4103(-)
MLDRCSLIDSQPPSSVVTPRLDGGDRPRFRDSQTLRARVSEPRRRQRASKTGTDKNGRARPAEKADHEKHDLQNAVVVGHVTQGLARGTEVWRPVHPRSDSLHQNCACCLPEHAVSPFLSPPKRQHAKHLVAATLWSLGAHSSNDGADVELACDGPLRWCLLDVLGPHVHHETATCDVPRARQFKELPEPQVWVVQASHVPLQEPQLLGPGWSWRHHAPSWHQGGNAKERKNRTGASHASDVNDFARIQFMH